MNFSAHTYGAVLSLGDRLARYGFVMTDIRLSYMRADGATQFRSFSDRASMDEYFTDTVSVGEFTPENEGVWSLCDCVLTRNVPFLPKVSYRVTDACGKNRTIRKRSIVASARILVDDYDADRSVGAVRIALDWYADVVASANAVLGSGIYGDLCFGEDYWREMQSY